ncbi:hypothetical protein DY023_06255 [Microbacterium bovistercoris]|uniref:Peptidoglycan binding-like domain-containing protein n=1 Tax=Microbacterium bovistercoris TaxID=2293570 RepID=A0A371NV14_9MICO|nr:hypothetical protein [Microbacterium bovistercoris]REJ06379.1 hypothetical protein DY023_06255 [Microbacterium bovistercoris]
MAGAGVIGAFFVLHPITPPTLAASKTITDTPVVLEDSTDEHSVRVTVKHADDIDLLSQAAGVVTSSSCTAGSTISSGTSVHSIDDRPIVLLSLASPLWRDFGLGDSGPDVAALKTELHRLGFTTTSGETFKQRDLKAVRELLKRAGVASQVNAVTVADFMWMPSPTLTIAACRALVGHRVEQDAPIVAADGGASASFAEEPAGLLPGARVLTIDGVEVALSADLSIPSEAIAVILEAPSYSTAKADAEGTAPIELAATVSLVDPVPLASLPPSAILITAGVDGCVGNKWATYAVRIVTSQLGRTVVQFDVEEVPEFVRLEAPASCA